jgi:predicted dehydrogenase
MEAPEAGTKLFGIDGYASLFPTEVRFKGNEEWEDVKDKWAKKSDHCDQIIYSEQMKHFVNCIRERITPSPGLVEGQIVMDIVDAAYKSSESGKVVQL